MDAVAGTVEGKEGGAVAGTAEMTEGGAVAGAVDMENCLAAGTVEAIDTVEAGLGLCGHRMVQNQHR